MTDSRPPRKPLRSWRWLLPCASIPLLTYLVLGALGGREHIVVLTGTHLQSDIEIILGISYILTYFALTLVSPVLVIAAGLIALRDRWIQRSPGN